MVHRLLENHFLASAVFLSVLVVGSLTFLQMPRQQDPTVNLNWVWVETLAPGMAASDVETEITDRLEEAIERVADIRFTASTSRHEHSLIAVRFHPISERRFDERVNDLRREIQTAEGSLPEAAGRPDVIKVTSANAFPTAMLALVGVADDETLRFHGQRIRQDLERMARVDRVDALGLHNPELQVLFDPMQLVGLGLSPSDIAHSVRAYFRDLAAGSMNFGDQEWLIRLRGTDRSPEYLAGIPLLSAHGEVPLRSVAEVVRGREQPAQLARHESQPAVVLSVFKTDDGNVIDLVGEVAQYLSDHNQVLASLGLRLVLLDDQTVGTRAALASMQRNAAYGLLLVLASTWILLGARIAFFATLGLVFVLAGTFLFLGLLGQTINIIVLLGLIISLGMLVDDTVVVAEAIHYRLQRGAPVRVAALGALREVAAPVTAAVLTTIAAFLPLMLVPGVLGDFMRVAPLVVAIALLLSLAEAFWILPSHIIAAGPRPGTQTRGQRLRHTLVFRARIRYGRALVGALRRPRLTLGLGVALLVLALAAVASGMIRTEFFATDSARLFYVNVTLPAGTRLEQTLETTLAVEEALRPHFRPGEVRALASYAGVQYSLEEPRYANANGQVMVSLHPMRPDGRSVDGIIESLRSAVSGIPGPETIGFETVTTGAPPTERPISIKVRGHDLAEIRAAADQVIGILQDIPAARDIGDDSAPGQMELSVRLHADAVVRAGLDPAILIRDIRLLTDGEVVASMRDRGETLDVRVRARSRSAQDIREFLDIPISRPDGSTIALSQLLTHETGRGEGHIRHHNLRRSITVEADLDRSLMDTPAVNRWVRAHWNRDHAPAFPGVDLDFTGEMDDIQESLDAIGSLFLLGLLLVYLILGTQFRSYLQPLVVLATVPMALTGVLIGLLVNQHPLSVYTLYGAVALAGIALNDAIVLISAANDRLRRGMGTLHAIVHAARRRLAPIVITSVTTIAGLFSLAVGLGGKSLMWGPLASAIVWGLMVSTLLTLFIIPVLYSLVARRSRATPG